MKVKLATSLVASRVTVPVGLVHGASQVIVKLAPVIGATGSLKLAVTTLVVIGTVVAVSLGDEVVTVGAAAATAPPRIGSLPLPHAVASTLSSKLAHNLRSTE